MGRYFSSNYKNITYPKDSEKQQGLRNAQIGAIHAIASFFTMSTKTAAITVMPTGSGKTAVLMMTPYLLGKNKVLVVTPSVMVRGQITEDFQELYTLCKANVFKPSMKKPKVYEMLHKYSEEVLPDLEMADAIIATPQCALSLSETDWAVKKISLVEVDEAHHTPAKTWQQILINLRNATHVLFTATPFRLDRKEIKGDIVYDYPLSLAYKDGIFGEIQFVPVSEGAGKDIRIARKAEEVLLSDRDDGLEHFLMVRTDTKDNAELLENLYKETTSLKLRRVDSSMSNAKIKQYIQELREHILDGIICVDMLGEGFDFPNLKIAAVHAPHKSLASTLQFIGRFARTNAKNIGKAKFIAAEDEDLEIENNRLFASDAVWQEMIINMSEGKNQKEQADRKYYKGYRTASSAGEEDRISLQAITLNCHDRIYKVTGFDIEADFPDEFNVGNRVHRNQEDNTIIGIGLEYVSPLWMSAEYKINKNYTLYILHYQKALGLLHIYSQSHTERIYERLAEAFCEKYDKIPKSEMNRVLGNLTGFEIFNSGMVNRYSESGESYRIMAGSDVSDAIDPSTGKMYSAGHVFCKATDSTAESITIGYSSASKVWSSEYRDIPDYVQWVEQLGKKITNNSIMVKTNTNYDYIPKAERLTEYPDKLFFADYADTTYSSPPIIRSRSRKDKRCKLTDFSLSILKSTKTQVTILITNDDFEVTLSCDLQGRYSSKDKDLYTHIRTDEYTLVDYFNDNPLVFKTFDDALISGFEIYRGNPDAISYNQDHIEAFDWESYNTDVGLEFGASPTGGKISIQDTIEKWLMADDRNTYILFDHGSGEIADFIAIQENDNQLIVRMFHAKRKSSVGYNSSMNDVYEVAGQAVKSIMWLTTKGRFVDKMSNRHQAGHCKALRGNFKECIRTLRDSSKQLTAFIVIVQPALSRSIKMPDKIQEVLAAVESYIKRTGKVQGLEVLGSK